MLACLVASILVLPAPAQAEKADREKPINYSADTGDVNMQTKAGTLTGNVVITQGTLTIHADKVNFKQNPDNSLSATAFGNPVSFRQKRDGVDEYFEGFAQRAEYDGTKNMLQLFDHALLRQGGNELRGEHITYNTATELFQADGGPAGKASGAAPETRVRGILQPKSAPAGKAGPPAKAGGSPAAMTGPESPVTLKPASALTAPQGK